MERLSAVVFLCGILTCNAVRGGETLPSLSGISAASSMRMETAKARRYKAGFAVEDGDIVCMPQQDRSGAGASWNVVLNQKEAAPFKVSMEAMAETADRQGEALMYLDIAYADGGHLWGVKKFFKTVPRGWEKREVLVSQSRAVKSFSVYAMTRNARTLKMRFRPPVVEIQSIPAGAGSVLFDGIPVLYRKQISSPCLMVRDVRAESGFESPQNGVAKGVRLKASEETRNGARFVEIDAEDVQGGDRALTVVWAVPAGDGALRYFDAADSGRRSVECGNVECRDTLMAACGTGAYSHWPFLAASAGGKGIAIGFDPRLPGFSRLVLNPKLRLLYAAFDIALVPEKRDARVGVVVFGFDAKDGFRGALEAYRKIFPEFNEVRQKKQGNWMAFGAISKVEGWEDFGFAVKEGDGETAWDDAHGIATFRYTEPTTWWMPIAGKEGRDSATMEECIAEAKRIVAEAKAYAAAETPPKDKKRKEKLHAMALAWEKCSFRDEDGGYCGIIRNTPWCNGIVWNMNCAPGQGPGAEFDVKLGDGQFAQNYGGEFPQGLDGEYVDSAEMYVTAVMDFNRANFAGMETPLSFSPGSLAPGVFKGAMGYEYVRAIWRKARSLGRLVMANGAPGKWWWLAPYLDVMGTETDWLSKGVWNPMTEEHLFHRRALCGAKPYCFLMNTDFNVFTDDKVDRYMQRALAYGMYPGFFSPHATSRSHYFKTPAYYDRDRKYFKKYMPLCIKVGEAGWRPVNRLVAADGKNIVTEQFGDSYATVYNMSTNETQTVLTSLSGAKSARELVNGGEWTFEGGKCTVRIPAESVRVLDFGR